MINIKFSNQASTTLTNSVSSSDTILTVDNVDGFPAITEDQYFMICVSSTTTGYEIMRVVSRRDSTFTVVRAQEGTAPKDFPVGANIENRLTAGSLYSVIENASETVPHAREDATSIGQGSESMFGHVRITDNDASEATSALGVGVSPYAMKIAFDKILGASVETILSTSGSFTAKVAGTYRVTAIGGGGNGGYGGYGGIGSMDSEHPFETRLRAHSGGAGGGGGAGQVKVQNVYLAKNQVVNFIIGGAGGQTSFGSYVYAVGGGHGGAGSNANVTDARWYCSNSNNHTPGYPGTGGAGGTTYGSAAYAGSNGYTAQGSGNHGVPTVNNGSQGGSGGITSDGTYGNGGNGGNGGGASMVGCSDDVIGNRTNTWGGSAGQAGTQGCIKIRLAVG